MAVEQIHIDTCIMYHELKCNYPTFQDWIFKKITTILTKWPASRQKGAFGYFRPDSGVSKRHMKCMQCSAETLKKW